jgi:hypothetical protein
MDIVEMNNSNAEKYLNLIQEVRNYGYTFVSEISELKTGKNKIFLRHDIDVSMDYAVKCAEVNKFHNVTSTFFLMVNSPFYNIIEHEERNYLQKLSELCGNIGLHANIKKRESNKKIQIEVELQKLILENVLKKKINVVSFHQPSQELIKFKFDGNIENTYSFYSGNNIAYYSDSNMQLDDELLKSDLRRGLNIQLLVHPIWWFMNLRRASDVWERLISIKNENIRKILLDTERTYKSDGSSS